MPHAMPPMQIRANPRSIIACARKTEGALMGIWQLIQQALLGKAAERPVAAQSPAPAVQAGKTVQTGKASQAGKARPTASGQRSQNSTKPQPQRSAQPGKPAGRQTQAMARQSHGGDTPLPSLDLVGRHYGTTKRSDSRRLEPQPLLDAATIANARSTIGNVEKNELSDEQISAIVGAAHNTLVLAGCRNRQNHHHRGVYRMAAEHRQGAAQ